jgi:hypothetical protein
MHPTADTLPLIFGNHAGRRVMPGVRSPERNSLMARDAHAVPLGRSNKRLNATAHSVALINLV